MSGSYWLNVFLILLVYVCAWFAPLISTHDVGNSYAMCGLWTIAIIVVRLCKGM